MVFYDLKYNDDHDYNENGLSFIVKRRSVGNSSIVEQ